MKVLHITSSLDGGGIASLLKDYTAKMDKDIGFDFVLTSTLIVKPSSLSMRLYCFLTRPNFSVEDKDLYLLFNR